MQDNPRAQAPKKERPFLPRLKDGGILARRGEVFFNEASIAYQIMEGIWSDDAKVLALRDLIVHW
jgi:hypothetical protein